MPPARKLRGCPTCAHCSLTPVCPLARSSPSETQFDNQGSYGAFPEVDVEGHWAQRASDWLILPSVQRTVLRRRQPPRLTAGADAKSTAEDIGAAAAVAEGLPSPHGARSLATTGAAAKRKSQAEASDGRSSRANKSSGGASPGTT